MQSDSGKLLVKFLPLSVTASVQPVDQGAIERMETHYRDIFRNMLMMAMIMMIIMIMIIMDEAVCVRCHTWVSYVWNMAKPTPINK
jgi:hypothetical protein